MNPKTAILGTVVVVVILTIGIIWYITEHPGATLIHQTATSTPIGGGGTKATPGHITEHAAYYDIDVTFPTATPLKGTAGATADAKAIAIMKGFGENTIDAFKENGNFAHLTPEDIHMQGLDQGRSYALSTTYQVYQSAHTVSYVYVLYEDTLGAHPNTYYRTFTFDSKTGAGLELGDIFAPGTNYVSTLSAIARKQLPALIAKKEQVSVSEVDSKMINDGTTPDADNFLNWYLDGSNLVIVFPPYQVAAYVAGVQLLTIPRSQLDLKSQYR